jgi:mono/diheme cytochrome c family protein
MRPALLVLALAVACSPAAADRAPSGGADVLATYCAKCHGGGKAAEGDFDFVKDRDKMIAAGLLVPGDAERSLVYRRMALGEMPPPQVKKRPSTEEIAAVAAWIDGMAEATAPAAFRTDAAIERALADDAAALARRDRADARWLTLAHLANAGVPERELERHRTALVELLASLTWSPAPRAPVWVDTERTIARIDLRELGWSTATWDAIRAAYPYGIARPDGVPDAIRADWFVATASRAPLYHDILGLPDTEAGLAQLLGIDLAANLESEAVVRAGFATSGVSVNNRVIERHATRFGALWRSYDFQSSVELENVFGHPLDFVPAGGEIIFNLPDGMQAYLLVDGSGRRLDKAPTTIVSDPRRPDRAVENAVSCIGCHAHGIVDRADQLRAVATKFERADRDRIRALHPPADELAAVFAADRARFVDALAALGVTPPADPKDEPITLVVARYEGELDLAGAAAELGLAPDELRTRLRRSDAVTKALAGLTETGGTVKRDSWVAVFARAVSDLGLGVPFTPSSSADAAPSVWIDRDRHTWVAGASAVDQRRASAACRRRGFSLPETDALIAALDQGLATGLRLGTGELWTRGVKLDASNQRYGQIVDPVAATSRRSAVAEAHPFVCVGD